MNGFTLTEVIIAAAIISFIIFYSSYIHPKIFDDYIIDESANNIVNILNLAYQKSLISENNSSWGVWLISSSTKNYFYLFQNSTSSLIQKYELPGNIKFFDFTEKIVIFQRLTGFTNSTTIKIGTSPTKYRIIKINELGNAQIE